MKKERGKICGFAEMFDTTDKYGVITGCVGSIVRHFEGRATTRENRGATSTSLPMQTDKSVGRPSGETVRQILLFGRQDIDDVMTGPAEGLEVVRIIVQTPEDERRLKRNRGKRIDGQPDRVAIRVDGRDNGDAGSEASEGIAQGAAVVLRLGHQV